MKISIIAAMDEKRGIGKNNKIPWHIKEDLQRFKTLTSGHAIIMGRKTWDSLPFKPLPKRLNIVITRNTSRQQDGLVFASSLEDAIQTGKSFELDSLRISPAHSPEIFIIGGGQIYEQAIEKELVDKLYLTLVDGSFDADTFFPDYSEFKIVGFEESHEGKEYKYKFLELERN